MMKFKKLKDNKNYFDVTYKRKDDINKKIFFI